MGYQQQHVCHSAMLLLAVLVIFCTVAPTVQQPFSYAVDEFTAASLREWQVMTLFQNYDYEPAQPQVLNPNRDGVLSLTHATGEVLQSAIAVLDQRVPWGTGFEANFTFRMFNAGVDRVKVNGSAYDPTNPDVGGDGITFAVFSTMPTRPGRFGGAMGYQGGDAAALENSFAIEFDTWNNPEYFDPINEGGVVGGDTNHIGLNLKGSVTSDKSVHVNTPFNDGGLKHVWVVYYEKAKTLQVFYNDLTPDKPAAPIFTRQIDLNQIMGAGTQQFVPAFTASCATAFANQTIESFAIRTLLGDEEPAEPAELPEPVPDPVLMLVKPAENYTDFSTADWVVDGSAAPISGGRLRLTNSREVELDPVTGLPDATPPGRAVLQTPVDCSVGCSIYTAFAITNDVRTVDQADLVAGGDGLALVLTASPELPPAEVALGGLGYAGIPNSVAVEVDTWYDDELDPIDPKNPDNTPQLVGPDGNHLGVSVGGNPKSIATVHLPSPANDNAQDVPAAQVRVKHMWVDIDNLNRTVKVFYNEVNATKPVAATLVAPLNLAEEVGATRVYPAFTSSTTTGLANHYVLAAAAQEALAILDTQGENKVAVTAATFPTFDVSTSRAFRPQGTASNRTAAGALPLTDPSTITPTAGSLLFIAPVNISRGLQLKISPSMLSNPGGEPDPADGSTARDGVALVLAGQRPAAPGAAGSGLGYGGLAKSVAVELDTHFNPEHDPADDGNHVGLNVNGELKSVVAAAVADDMADGEPKFVWLDWDAQEKVARVYYNYRDSKPAAPALTHPIDLPVTLGTSAPFLLITSGTNGTAGAPATNTLGAVQILGAKPDPPAATNISRFTPEVVAGLRRGGVAAGLEPTADGALPLTSGARERQAGLVLLGPAVDISKGLSAHAQVVMTAAATSPADPSDDARGGNGLALLLMASNATTPGLPASGMGYGGRNDTVAVELDAWNDPVDPAGDGNHIGINTRGDLRSLATVKVPGNFADGKPRDVWVDYNNVAKTLQVYYNPVNSTKPATPILTRAAIDIPALLRTSRVFVAVSSGTDGTAPGAPTTQLLNKVSIMPGNPDAAKPRSYNFSDPAAAEAWQGGQPTEDGGLSITGEDGFGATVLQQPLDLAEGFSTYMQVVMNPGGVADAADDSTGPHGMALLLLRNASVTSATPAQLPADGLGYGGVARSVAVELDTFHTREWDPNTPGGRPDGNHVGVNINGQLKSLAAASVPGNLADGAPKHVWVDYSAVRKHLQVYVNPGAAEKPIDPLLTVPVDVEEVVGADTAFLAVTSGSGSPVAQAVLRAVRIQPGRVDRSAPGFAGPNSISKVDAESIKALTRSGPAAQLGPNPDGSVPLADPSLREAQANLVILPQPVDLSRGLSSHFQVKLPGAPGAVTDPADGSVGSGGAAVVLLPSNTVTAGSPDSGLGYQGIAGKSVAVEMDKFFDGGADPVSPTTNGTLQVLGADGNHIGLNYDGATNSTATAHITRDLTSEVPNNLWLDYDPASKTTLIYFNGPNATKPTTPTLLAPGDLAEALGTKDAYIGVSAGTREGSTRAALVASRVVSVSPVLPKADALGPPKPTVLRFDPATVADIPRFGAVTEVAQPDGQGMLKLTDSSRLSKQGSLLVLSPRLDISKGLQSRFQFQFVASNDTDLDPADDLHGRDGAAIVFLGLPASDLKEGLPGEGLGYGGLNKSLAIELDTFHDADHDPISSAGIPDGNHVGINTNGELMSHLSAPLAANLNDGKPKNLWIDIDSISQVVYVYVADAELPAGAGGQPSNADPAATAVEPAKPAAPLLSAKLDVLGLLGTDKPILAVTSGAQGASRVVDHFLREARWQSVQPPAALAAGAAALPAAGAAKPAGVTSRSFTKFNPATLQAFTLQGASETTPFSWLSLTDSNVPQGPQSGLAMLKEPLSASTGFSVYVRPQLTAAEAGMGDPADGSKGRDGMAVVFMASNATLPGDAARGSGLGYAGLERSVAVELDTWKDAWDPDSQHLGINLGGSTTSLATKPLEGNVADGQDRHMWVDYDNMAQALSVFFSNSATKPSEPSLTATVDLPGQLGTDQPYLAVTSGTTDLAATHVVKALSFKSGEALPSAKTRSFPSFTPEAIASSMTLQGSAVADPFTPGTIALTTDTPSNQAGLVRLQQPLDLSQGLSAMMQFDMDNTLRAEPDPSGGSPGGEGMTMVLMGEGADGPGEAGAGLGYGGMKGKSLAVELDTYYNQGTDPTDPKHPWGLPQINGPDGNHLGLNLNGAVKSVVLEHVALDINDGGLKTAWLEVDSVNRMVHVYYNPDNTTKPAMPALSYPLEKPLNEVLGTATPALAITAGSTNGGTVHRLRSLSVTEGPVPNPFSFPRPGGAAWSPWNLAGGARPAAGSPSALELTATGSPGAGRATLPNPVNMTKGLSLKFMADMKSSGMTAQDGLALVLLPSQLTDAPSGDMGLAPLKKYVAVELDPFFDTGVDPQDTPLPPPSKDKFSGDDGNHIGINVNGMKSAAAVRVPEPLADGRFKHVWVDYDNAAKVLWVYLSSNNTKPATPILTHSIDVQKTLGTAWPYVALSSGSRDGSTTTTVRSLSFLPGTPPAGPAAPKSKGANKLSNAEIALLVIGLVAAVVILALLIWWGCNHWACCRCGRPKQRKADPLYVV